MLTESQRYAIQRCGVATLHDYRTVSPMSGEAFLEDGILFYYDGRMLLVCAQPLRDARSLRAARTRELVLRFVDRHAVDSVLYVGGEPLSLRELRSRNFFDDGVQRRRARAAELFLPIREAYRSPRLSRLYRRATRNGFAARCRAGGMVDASLLTLAETFYAGLPLSEYLAELAVTLSLTLMLPEVTIIEAWDRGAVRGFVTVHEPFDGVSVALFMAHDRVTRGVSDFLYSQLIDHARARNSEFVNVGPSASEGHYRFKRKWRGVPLVPPYYAATWRRRGARCTRHRTWLLRILGRN